MLTPNVNLTGKTILVTGAAGFIGSNLVMELLRTVEKVTIVGLDNMNDYYDVAIKEYRLQEIDKLAVVMGTEGDGLAASTIAGCDYTVMIPMSHGVDSLNVAAASAVAFWQLRVK